MAISRKSQAGLTLIEFMVSIAIGMLLIAAVATLIANQSSTRADLDKSGRMIENGRYGMRVVMEDAQLAGYWGEMSDMGAVTPANSIPAPCSTSPANIESAMGVHVQGYDGNGTDFPSCIEYRKLGTDVLVVRRAEPVTSAVSTAASTPSQVFVQTGLNTSLAFDKRVLAGSSSASFDLLKKDKTPAPLRKVLVHIYYISECSVQGPSGCSNGDGIPTLKMMELAESGAMRKVTISEGIENLQVEFGRDSDNDGAPNGADLDLNGKPDADFNGSTCSMCTAANPAGCDPGVCTATAAFKSGSDWSNVMTLTVRLLARSNDVIAGYVDKKIYSLGRTQGLISDANAEVTITAGPFNDGYKRHVFTQSIRLVNPSMRRAP